MWEWITEAQIMTTHRMYILTRNFIEQVRLHLTVFVYICVQK